MNRFKGYAFILGATLFWGISATTARFLFTQHFDALVLVQMRMSLSCLMILSFFLLLKRKFLVIKLSDLPHFALLGLIGGAGSNFTYYFTIQQTNVATAILLQYLAPVLVLAYAAVTKEENLSIVKTVAGIVSLAGCYLAIAGKDFSFLTINKLGLFTGFVSAFCWAFTNVWLRHLIKRYSVWTCLVYSFIFASVFWLVVNPPWVIVAAHYSPATWGMFFLFAVISILIPHSLYFGGIRYLTASRAIITATFEPIVAILSAFLILGEVLSGIQIFGAMMVIAAIAILQLRQEPDVEDSTRNTVTVQYSISE
jgi:drug/metabolite transporter (DMT)-like permease